LLGNIHGLFNIRLIPRPVAFRRSNTYLIEIGKCGILRNRDTPRSPQEICCVAVSALSGINRSGQPPKYSKAARWAKSHDRIF
ncbi:hypothetical protein ACL1GK_14500, partial [Corynebacterium striatum]